MKLVKRILAVVLSLCVVLALSACAGKPRKPSAEDAEKHVRAALDLMCTGDFDHSVHLAEEDELKTTAEAAVDEAMDDLFLQMDLREDVLEAAKKMGCSILFSGHKTMNTSRYTYFAPPVSKIMSTKVVKFYANELAEDVGTKMMQTRYHAYPIVDENDRIVGCASRFHIMNSKNKKIILVDHNEFSQSVRAIEKAEVLEVIAHHRLNDFYALSLSEMRS